MFYYGYDKCLSNRNRSYYYEQQRFLTIVSVIYKTKKYVPDKKKYRKSTVNPKKNLL